MGAVGLCRPSSNVRYLFVLTVALIDCDYINKSWNMFSFWSSFDSERIDKYVPCKIVSYFHEKFANLMQIPHELLSLSLEKVHSCTWFRSRYFFLDCVSVINLFFTSSAHIGTIKSNERNRKSIRRGMILTFHFNSSQDVLLHGVPVKNSYQKPLRRW